MRDIMVEEYGKLRLKDPNSGYEFSFGIITGIQESFQKSGSTFPLVAMAAENTIVIDTKTAKVITISFTRNQPENIDDSSADMGKWSNATWFDTISKAVNRWQCRTDGYRLTYVPSADNPYIAPIDENGYLRNFTARYVSGTPTKLKGSFEFHVGTMYVGSQMPSNNEESRALKDFQIALYGKDESSTPYILLGDKINCVESYTIHGGPEAPFEYVTMKIPKKELKQIAPGLFEGEDVGIVPGMNRLTISAIGTSTMTVTKVKLSNDSYTITAYCEAERIRGYTLSSSGQLTPSSWINKILSGGEYGGLKFSGSTLVTNYDEALSNLVGEIEFKKGTNVWYILQVCAMCVCARVFFADNKAYVVDYCRELSSCPRYESKIDLHPSSGNDMYLGATLGDVDMGDEGIDTIVNTVSISCITPQMKDGIYVISGEDKSIQFTTFNYYTYWDDKGSVRVFKERAANTIYLPELKQNDPDNMPKDGELDDIEPEAEGLILDTASVKKVFHQYDEFTYAGLSVYEVTDEGNVRLNLDDCSILEPNMSKVGAQEVRVSYNDKYATYIIVVKLPRFKQAEIFAKNYISYRSEPQQTVSFTLKEMHKVNNVPTWKPYFGPASIAGQIYDNVNDVNVSNISAIDKTNPVYQKLALSTYSRSYPEGKSTYTWGVLSTIDLSSNTSQITTSLGNVK